MRSSLFILTITSIFILSCGRGAEEGTNNPQTENSGNQQSVPQSSDSPIDSISTLIAQQGVSVELLLDRASLYLAINRVDQARNDINQARSIDSSEARINELQGELHFVLNHSRRAKEEWEECIRKNPENSNCLLNLAELMVAVKNYKRALDLVNKQIEIDDKDPHAYFIKGIIVRDRYADTALALQYFQNAIDLDQDYYEAIDMMAVTLTEQKDTLAKFYYDRMLQMEPNDASTYFKLGVYYQGQNEVNRALESYTTATELNPRDADSYYNLGYINMELAQYTQAREYFTLAIRYKENNYRAYFGRAYSYEVVGDLINAKKDYERAIEILPVFEPAAKGLSRVNALMKQQ